MTAIATGDIDTYSAVLKKSPMLAFHNEKVRRFIQIIDNEKKRANNFIGLTRLGED